MLSHLLTARQFLRSETEREKGDDPTVEAQQFTSSESPASAFLPFPGDVWSARGSWASIGILGDELFST